MRAVGRAAQREGACYLVGGSSAVLVGWRPTTVDIDVRFEPEQDEVLRELQRLKRELGINIELASPAEFIPLPAGWEGRSPSVGREGQLTFHHFDFYAQALAKLERGHARDLADVVAMRERALIEPDRLRRYFEEIEPELYRFPAINAERFRQRVDAASS